MKKLGIIIMFLQCFVTSKAQWSKKDEVMIIIKTYNQGINLGLTEIQSTEYAYCVLQKFMVAIPNPNTSKKTPDEAREIGKKIGADCLAGYQLKISWNPKSEEMLRSYFNDSKEFKVLTQEAKDKFNNCVIGKLKAKYPDGFSKLPEKEAEQIGGECMELLLKGNN